MFYLVVTVHDLFEVRLHWREGNHQDRNQILEYTAAASYVWGTILFTVGSIFFLSAVGWFQAGAWTFVVGSLLFVVGACINVLLNFQSQPIITFQLMNLTAVSFVIGSVLFTQWPRDIPVGQFLVPGIICESSIKNDTGTGM